VSAPHCGRNSITHEFLLYGRPIIDELMDNNNTVVSTAATDGYAKNS